MRLSQCCAQNEIEALSIRSLAIPLVRVVSTDLPWSAPLVAAGRAQDTPYIGGREKSSQSARK